MRRELWWSAKCDVHCAIFIECICCALYYVQCVIIKFIIFLCALSGYLGAWCVLSALCFVSFLQMCNCELGVLGNLVWFLGAFALCYYIEAMCKCVARLLCKFFFLCVCKDVVQNPLCGCRTISSKVQSANERCVQEGAIRCNKWVQYTTKCNVNWCALWVLCVS